MLKPYFSPSMCAVQTGQLIINVTGPRPVAVEDWSGYVKVVAEATPAWLNALSPACVVLTYSPVEAPNAAQRAQLAAEPQGRALSIVKRVAFCTESSMVRGAMTALGWLSRAPTVVKPFRTSDKDQALAWLAEIGEFEHSEALRQLHYLQEHLRNAASG